MSPTPGSEPDGDTVELVRRLASHYPDAVVVDEYQDLNSAQRFRPRPDYAEGPGARGEGATLIGVDDDWQAIFGFQGATRY